MDFFHLSKLLWLLAEPGNLLVPVLAVAALAAWRGWRRLGRGLVTLTALALLAAMVLPLDHWLAAPLEDRFPPAALPPCVEGILVLSGGEAPRISAARGEPVVREAGRYAAAAALLRRFPHARLVISGGSPALLHRPRLSEAETGAAFLAELGIDAERVTLETESRNTFENLERSKQLVAPRPGAVWVLVTRALHMPRAIGIARGLGWTMLAWPTDYLTDGRLEWGHASLASSLERIDAATKEWIGLAAYRLTGRSAALLPGPEAPPACSAP